MATYLLAVGTLDYGALKMERREICICYCTEPYLFWLAWDLCIIWL